MDALVQKLRFAGRTLLKRPGFTVVVVLTLGLGIGANTAIFSLVHTILIEPLPYPDADRLVAVEHAAPGLDMPEAGQSDGTYLHYRKHNRVFEEMALYNENVVNIAAGAGAPERVQVALVTHDFFSTLGATPALGRLFTAADGRADGPVRVVIAHGLWTRRFGSDPAIVGRTIELNRAPKRVVGVVEPGFDFPRRETQIWYASDPDPARADVSDLYYSGIARLAPGVTSGEAEADLNRLIPSLADAYADATPELLENARLSAVVQPLKDAVVGNVGTTLWLLLGGMGFLLLIACANVANLFLVRAEHRRTEVAVRLALGAGRGDLTRYFLSEGVLVAALGGAIGLAIAYVGVQAIVAFGPANLPRLHEAGINGWVLAFTAGLAVATGLLFGAIPALRDARVDLTSALKEGGHGATAGRERQRARRLLVASQIALALTLLIGSALMVQSFWRLSHVDPGFDPEGVLTMEIALPYGPYPDYAAQAAFWNRLLDRVRALPGVEAAGAVSGLPLSSPTLKRYLEDPLAVEGRTSTSQETLPAVGFRSVTPGYFEAMRIPRIEGERFRPGDRTDARNPALISTALAERLFPGGDPIGRRVRNADRADQPWTTIVGVVGDIRDESMRAEPAEVLYIPVLDGYETVPLRPSHMSLAIRTSLPPLSLVPAVRRIVRDVDPVLPITNVRSMQRIVADATARESFTMLLLLIAAAAALFLGVVGLYGVVSYAVSRRMHEIGVRIALGARAADVRRMVVGQGAVLALVGLATGVVAALALTRFLGGLLFEVSPTDPVTIAAMAALLLMVAVLASYLPARRAAGVDPMIALRNE